jgi:hypothetical protein
MSQLVSTAKKYLAVSADGGFLLAQGILFTNDVPFRSSVRQNCPGSRDDETGFQEPRKPSGGFFLSASAFLSAAVSRNV